MDSQVYSYYLARRFGGCYVDGDMKVSISLSLLFASPVVGQVYMALVCEFGRGERKTFDF